MGIEIILSATLAAAWYGFAYQRLLRYLHLLQQEDYYISRFWHWWRQRRLWDRTASLGCLVGGLGAAPLTPPLPLLVAAVLFAALTLLERRRRRDAKKPLVMTERARRLLRAALVCCAPCPWGAALLFHHGYLTGAWLSLALAVQFIPAALTLATALLQPAERRRQNSYIRQAKERLAAIDPFVIGITGSYGKTSSKHALAHLLQLTKGPTFWPADGINTDMGITRALREKLQAGHRYAVIEMAAYGDGSIARLCRLTPPQAGLLTGVGLAHMERFGDQKAIQRTKGALAEALPDGALLVCNGDSPLARAIGVAHSGRLRVLFYGHDNAAGPLHCSVDDLETTVAGSHFTLHWQGDRYRCFAPLHGRPLLLNLAGAFAMACALGADPSFAAASLASLRPVSNRLQVQSDGVTVTLHDGYNSNPDGFNAALEVMRALPGQRRLLLTPGMVELGPYQEPLNRQAAMTAARCCDIAFVIGEVNKHALCQGLQQGGMPADKILCLPSRDSAFDALRGLTAPGDIILIENDLVDLYEAPLRF